MLLITSGGKKNKRMLNSSSEEEMLVKKKEKALCYFLVKHPEKWIATLCNSKGTWSFPKEKTITFLKKCD